MIRYSIDPSGVLAMRRAALPVTFTNLLHHVATGRADYKVRKASFGKYFRLRLDDVEYLVAEGAQELLRVDRTNAADHSRGQVLLDALGRRRSRGLEEPGFELLTVGAVVDPMAGRCNPLASRNRGGTSSLVVFAHLTRSPRIEKRRLRLFAQLAFSSLLKNPSP